MANAPKSFYTEFQFTPLREGRHYLNKHGIDGELFQFTPLREGRPVDGAEATAGGDFNSRPSARGDSPANVRIEIRLLFQFTPLREGRRFHLLVLALVLISIHAPP